MTPEELVASFGSSPGAYVHKVEIAAAAALIVSFGPDVFRTATFLDDRALGPHVSGAWFPLSDVVTRARSIESPLPVHFVFHMGHVGSTLLTRLLDEAGGVLCLREPLPLRTLADAADVLGRADSILEEREFDALLAAIMRCWARGYPETRAVVVKAPSLTARVAPRVLRFAPAVRAVHLSIRAPDYVAAWLARSGVPVDLRAYGPERIRRLQAKLPTPIAPLWSLSTGELAAMSWLTEKITQQDAAREFGERVLELDFDRALQDIGATMTRVLMHFGVPPDADYAARAEKSPSLGRHAKTPNVAYSPAVRRQKLHESHRQHGTEIQKGMAWIEKLARTEQSVADALAD